MFNSDMILGRYGKEINLQFVTKLAQAILSLYKDQHLVFVIGKDTRQENYELEKTLAKVLSSLGANVFLLGVTSTGAVAFATKAYKATAGIMLTGSSKPNKFVGFKIFNGNGFKISDEQIEALKYKFENISELKLRHRQGQVFYKPYFNFEYINFLKQFSKINFTNTIKLLADLSCGSGEEIYEELMLCLRIKTFLAYGSYDCEKVSLSFQRALIFDKTNTFKAQDAFGKAKNYKDFFDFKVVFDTDCDKLILFDNKGKKISNEQLLMLFALEEKKKNDKAKVVLGSFLNGRVFDFFERYEISYFLKDTSIKQKDLIHEAVKQEADLAGDGLGNIVFLKHLKTSDAFLTLIKFLNIYNNNFKLLKEVLSFKLNKRYVKRIKVDKSFDIEKFKEKVSICEMSLLEKGKILVLYNKFWEYVEVYIETDEEELKDEIFVFLQEYFKKDKSLL